MHDQHTVDFVHKFCQQNLNKYGYHELYLIGSRAKNTERNDSDHDFVAVVNDSAPDNILAGYNNQMIDLLRHEATRKGIGKIDLLVARNSRVHQLNPTEDELTPYACQNNGKLLWP
jgi:predicted nucleotidyltransferase